MQISLLELVALLLGAWVVLFAMLTLYDRFREARYERELARMEAMYTGALAKLGNAQAFGTPTPTGGDMEEREPEPETRAARQVDQEVLDRATDMLRREYEAVGVKHMSADDLEAEVRLIMRGETPRVPQDLAPFVRDG